MKMSLKTNISFFVSLFLEIFNGDGKQENDIIIEPVAFVLHVVLLLNNLWHPSFKIILWIIKKYVLTGSVFIGANKTFLHFFVGDLYLQAPAAI